MPGVSRQNGIWPGEFGSVRGKVLESDAGIPEGVQSVPEGQTETLPVSDKNSIRPPRAIRKEPADGNGPPDSDDTEYGNRRECIRQSDPGAERDNGQNDGHSRIADGTIEAVEAGTGSR